MFVSSRECDSVRKIVFPKSKPGIGNANRDGVAFPTYIQISISGSESGMRLKIEKKSAVWDLDGFE